ECMHVGARMTREVTGVLGEGDGSMVHREPSAQRAVDWLESLGLAQYSQAFAQHSITWELLGELSSEDLRDIGVAPLGHRKRLLKAIAALRATDFIPPGAIGAPSATRRTHAERRQLTLLICDLVDSVRLSLQFDPEDLNAIISHYQACCEQVV